MQRVFSLNFFLNLFTVYTQQQRQPTLPTCTQCSRITDNKSKQNIFRTRIQDENNQKSIYDYSFSQSK